jgi:4-carboxymuconolactone decarboxylase
MSDDAIEKGKKMRRRLLGANSDAQLATGAAAQLAPDFNELLDRSLFGETWTDPRLEIVQRSLITISALVVLGREAQLRTHVRAGLRVGLTRDEIVGAVLHLAFYAGVPAAYSALEIVRAVLAEVEAEVAANGGP